MPPAENKTAPPRAGEELDLARLEQWLGQGPVECEQFPAGHSNLTYLIRAAGREYVLRRPPFGTQVKSAHDMEREYRVLSKLHTVYPLAPRPSAYCDDPAVLGARFYLMERLPGIVVRDMLPEALAASPEQCHRLSLAAVDNLATLHGIDLQAAGLLGLGKPQGYVRRQIEGWSRRWIDAQTEPVPAMDEAAKWLASEMPGESGAALIHNDYKLDNILLDPDDPSKLTGLLDWEMATIGDPLMDLGTALSYWIEAGDPEWFRSLRFSPTTGAGFITRREYVQRYSEKSGREVANPVYYYVYGLFKLAVILQQIHYRYVHGHTHDHRFAGLGEVTKGLGRRAREAIEAGLY